MRFSFVLLLGAILASEVPAEKEPTPISQLQGVWVPESMEYKGIQLLESEGNRIIRLRRCVVSANNLTIHYGKGTEIPATIHVDPKSSPKSIDLIGKDGRCEMKGIYAIDGDILLVAIAGQERSRPKRFNSTSQEGVAVYTFKRTKR